MRSLFRYRWAAAGLLACLGSAAAQERALPTTVVIPVTPPPAPTTQPDMLVIPATLPPNPTADAFPPLPNILQRPIDPARPDAFPEGPLSHTFGGYPFDPPLGYTGPSGIAPRVKPDKDFVPIEDRWRIGFPEWDRYEYGPEKARTRDYPYQLGRLFDPFNQNVIKGDYPIIGQHTFLNITASQTSIFEGRQLPTPTTPFESTARPFQEEFFGRPVQSIAQNFTKLSFDLFHGDASFKPVDWRVKVTPIFNFNTVDVDELGIIHPDVRKGTVRNRSWFTVEEYFAEAKLVDLSPDYDFASVRIGSQFFNSDFRSFIFSDTNRAIRLFGTLNANRDQFNLVYFRQAEKDTNSGLNTFEDRQQNIFIANYYRQDFIWPGYTAQASIHYNNDRPDIVFDDNRFLVRPDPTGVFQPHSINAAYLGWTGDGHIGRYNITHAVYWALGRDSLNPIANKPQVINGQMAALELSYDRDWARFRGSFFYSSGDNNPNNRRATGFDSILDNPNFAGGEFSFWQRQAIGLFGVNLVQRQSLIPDLRSSKIQGQSNFVNPGLNLFNAGFDADITPKLKMINNANFLMFDKTAVLETFTFDGNLSREIGVDLSVGFEYRPLLSNNVIFTYGVSSLIPGRGFRELYNRLGKDVDTLFAGFVEMNLTF